MSVVSPAVERLLALGCAGSHPASAIAGMRTAAGTTVTAGGWARLPADGLPGEPMTSEMLIDLASITKVAATTTLIMCLVAGEQLRLEAPAHRFLPSFTGTGKVLVNITDSGIVAGTTYTLATVGSTNLTTANIGLGTVPAGLNATVEVVGTAVQLKVAAPGSGGGGAFGLGQIIGLLGMFLFGRRAGRKTA